MEVDLEAFDFLVDERAGQANCIGEGEEAALEVGAGEAGGAVAVEEPLQPWETVAAVGAPRLLVEVAEVEPAEAVGLVDGAGEVVVRCDVGEVTRVRLTVVVGIPRTTVTEEEGSVRVRCRSMPPWPWPERRAVVTSISLRRDGSSSTHSAAASRWLRTAPAPQVRTAAVQRASMHTAAPPTMYTPR